MAFFFLGLSPAWFFLRKTSDSFPEEESKPAEYFSLIILPDTQYYSKSYPWIFKNQTEWIVRNQKKEQIVFVSHLGDITDSREVEREWQNARAALDLLEGVVPYGLCSGNHDNPVFFNQYFSFQRFQKQFWWGGHCQKASQNNYQYFSGGGMAFVILHLEYDPDQAVLDWADQILKENSEKRAIVTSHYILDYGGLRSRVGQRIFEALKDNLNLFLMLAGHIHSEAHRTDIVGGRPIHQLLADYQNLENGGNGWLRILRFFPSEDKIRVKTYSPYIDKFETDSNSQFELDYLMKS